MNIANRVMPDRRAGFQHTPPRLPNMVPPMERVPRGGCPESPPTNEQRWASIKDAYRAFRNQEEAIA